MDRLKGREKQVAAILFLLVICDPVIAAFCGGEFYAGQFSEDARSNLQGEWEGAMEISPEAGHALGVAVEGWPPLWGMPFRFPAPKGFPPRARVTIAGLAPETVGEEVVVWSMRDHLARGVAEVISGGKSNPCTDYDGLRLDCGDRSHEFVGKYAGAFRGVDLPCTWLHPPKEGELVVRVMDLPATRRVTGFAGLLDGAGKRATVHVEGRFNARKIFKVTLSKDWKFVPLTSKKLKPAPGDLELRIRTEDPQWRLLCIGLYGLGEE